MQKQILGIVSFLIILMSCPFSVVRAEDFNRMSIEQLEKGIENQHPAAYYVLAQKLFVSGRKNEAVFWFYAGQLRYRAYLLCNTGLKPDGDPALFASLSEVIGRPINVYAFGNVDDLVATIDRVLVWDVKTANGFKPVEKCRTQTASVREGLVKMRQETLRNAGEIRRQRIRNGLTNR